MVPYLWLRWWRFGIFSRVNGSVNLITSVKKIVLFIFLGEIIITGL